MSGADGLDRTPDLRDFEPATVPAPGGAHHDHPLDQHELAVEAVVLPESEAATPPRLHGPARRAVRRFRSNPAAMIGLAWVVLMILVAIFAPLIAPFGRDQVLAGPKFSGFSWDHLLGTDELGRDTFTRLVYGTRVSVRGSFQVVVVAAFIGTAIGLAAGYLSGAFDFVAIRGLEIIQALPVLVLTLAVVAALGPGLSNALAAISIALIPGIARLVRGQALAIREETYVEASQSIGTPKRTVMRRRVLPNLASPLIVSTSIALGGALIAESAISFLGFGAQPPTPSWGKMLADSQQYIFTEPAQLLVPGCAIALMVLSFNLVGDGLRDALGGGTTTAVRTKGLKHRLGITTVVPSAYEGNAVAERVAAVVSSGPAPLLSVRDLRIGYDTDTGPVTVVHGVSFDVKPGEVVGLVGESGSGKTQTSLAIMRLVPSPPGRIEGGSVTFDGRDLLALSPEAIREVRGNDIAMIFQDPMQSLNPAFTVGNQMVEALRLHTDLSRKQAPARAAELLDLVGIADPVARLKVYPHQLSGGMRQRVMIAMALCCSPRLLIADEPTTALDVTIQAQILELLKALQKELGMAVIFVTHDLGVVADICDRVVVMYAGQVVEEGMVEDIFATPRHPYTEALLGAIPQLAGPGEMLASIPGVVPTPAEMPIGCRFGARCAYHEAVCDAPVPLLRADEVRAARCTRLPDLHLRGVE